jgi:hypothetical protein
MSSVTGIPRFGETEGRLVRDATAIIGGADRGTSAAEDGCAVGAASPAAGNATPTVVGASDGDCDAAGEDDAARVRSGNTSPAGLTVRAGGVVSAALTAGDADAGNSESISRTGGRPAGADATDALDPVGAATTGGVDAAGAAGDAAAVSLPVFTGAGVMPAAAVGELPTVTRAAPGNPTVLKLTDDRGT